MLYKNCKCFLLTKIWRYGIKMAVATQVQISEIPRELHKIVQPWFQNQKNIYTHELPLCAGWAFLLPFFPTSYTPQIAKDHGIYPHAFPYFYPSAWRFLSPLFFNVLFWNNCNHKNSKTIYKECLNTLYPDSPNFIFTKISLSFFLCICVYMHIIYRYMF